MTYELKIVTDDAAEIIALLQVVGCKCETSQMVASQCGDNNTAVVNTGVVNIEKKPVQPSVVAPAGAEAPMVAPAPAQPSYSVDDLARAAAPLMDDPEGVRMLQELLASFGAVSLVDLDKAKLAAFAEGLRNLGVVL